jgi:hypothetical protein
VRVATDTELKLRDAKVQLDLLMKNAPNDEIVRSCLNAFISHARSVTFVMQRESAGTAGLEEWYRSRMDELSKLPILQFFNSKRVHSIHRGVVTPGKRVMQGTVTRAGPGFVEGPVIITTLEFDGVSESMPGENGNVGRLCKAYVGLLDSLVAEWLDRWAQVGRRASRN